MSNEYSYDESKFDSLEGKVAVLTGGASGIGREAVKLFAKAGARVVFGDINKAGGDELASELGSNVKCCATDVTSWKDLKALFMTATDAFGAPDIVCANTGIHERRLAFRTVSRAGDQMAIGSCQFLGSFEQSGKSGSIVLTSSAAGYFDSTPVCMYAGTKHAVVGLLRSFSTITPVYNNSRINLIAPWMVDTNFAGGEVKARFGDLPLNTAEGCAKGIIMCAANPGLHGCGFFVGGDRFFELEGGYHKSMPEWLGVEMTNGFREGWKRCSAPFGKGGSLSKLH